MNILNRIGMIVLIMFLSNCVNDLTLSGIEKFIDTPLPSRATNVHFHSELGIDRIVLLRFDLPKDDVPVFLSSLGITSFMSYSTLHDSPHIEWWQPEQAEQIGSYQAAYHRINSKGVHILIAELSDDMVVVYLEVGG
jgi:hypothetical protein